MDDKLYIPRGSSGDHAFSLVVTPEQAGWTYSGLRVLQLPPGGTHTWATGEDELLVLPLAGRRRWPVRARPLNSKAAGACSPASATSATRRATPRSP